MNPETPKPAAVVNPPPSQLQTLAGYVPHALGILLCLVAYGYQGAQKDHPEIVSAMGDSVDWVMLMGLCSSAGGLLLKSNHDSAARAAVNSARIAPPVDARTGCTSAQHTVGVAVRQAISAGNKKLAGALVAALPDDMKPHDCGGDE